MSKFRPPPKVSLNMHENYRTININGFFGGHRPGFLEAIIFTDEIDPADALSTIPPDSNKVTIKRTVQARLVLDPYQAKSLLKWLQGHMDAYEKTFGELKGPKEMGKEGHKDSAIYT